MAADWPVISFLANCLGFEVSARTMTVLKVYVLPLAALLVAVALCSPALASTLCGDDVGGQRVACRCGDTVVSSTRLQPDDPVVTNRCPHNGLQLRAAGNLDSLVLELAGLSLIGSGSGTGILILDGGKQGAVIIGGNPSEPGHVSGFRRAIHALGRTGLKEIYNLVMSANGGDHTAASTDSTEVPQ